MTPDQKYIPCAGNIGKIFLFSVCPGLETKKAFLPSAARSHDADNIPERQITNLASEMALASSAVSKMRNHLDIFRKYL